MLKRGGLNGVKVIVIGDGNVGKSSLLRRFVTGTFSNQYNRTVGVEYMEKSVCLRQRSTTVNLFLWDTAGQETVSSVKDIYYLDAAVAILVFSTDSSESFARIEMWKRCVERVCGSIPMVLCQTKFDLARQAAVVAEEVEKLAVKLQLPLFRVSTKDGFNVTQLFEYVAAMCVSEAPGGECGPSGKLKSEADGNGSTGAGNAGKSSKSGGAGKKSSKKSKKKKCSVM
ncbi:small GTPase, putative [Trypanosoma equiperdum]|uniref:Small GTPase, putative n=3 Tax=Trypanozoon TaxID=39700 RepID=Q38AB6_TRYB2|nr:small GTPase, putative [Trypanosoma brucei brucei TREU927]EAN78254.1 small GTPase, putative [Trypanosoma brucei brucei TREU927]SCU71739.1 small GTPase, putative [Trypanosoma equiperdum]